MKKDLEMIAEGILVDTNQGQQQQLEQQQLQQQQLMDQQHLQQQQQLQQQQMHQQMQQQQTAMPAPSPQQFQSGPMQSGPMPSGTIGATNGTNGSTRKPGRDGDGCCDNARERAKDAVAKVAPCACKFQLLDCVR